MGRHAKRDLGPTPSRRRAADWRATVRELTGAIMDLMVSECGETEGATIRRKVLSIARQALGEAPTDQLVEGMSYTIGRPLDSGPEALAAQAGMLRVVLDGMRPDWSDPVAAESVMAEVQRAVDAWFRSRLEAFSRAVAAMEFGRSSARDSAGREAILVRVMEHARQAVGGDPDAERRVLGRGGAVMGTPAGLLRTAVTGLEVPDAASARALLDLIERAAREQLRRRDPSRVEAA